MTIADSELDITDVYAFMRPEGTGPAFTPSTHLVLVMNVHPGATATSRFYPGGEYTFRVAHLLGDLTDDVPYNIVCTANNGTETTQVVLCNAVGTFGSAVINAAPTGDTTSPLRVWAGLRSDPAFLDRSKLNDSLSTKSLKFVNPGTNTFQGQNVLSIVVELDVKTVLNPTNAPLTGGLFAVAGDTQRIF